MKEVWLGIVKNEEKTFTEQSVADAEKYLEYVDGAPYRHIQGVTLKMETAPQMCVRAKRTEGDFWGDKSCEGWDAHPLCEFNCGNLNDG